MSGSDLQGWERAISAAARSTMMVAAMPSRQKKRSEYSQGVKSNLAQRPSSLKYIIQRSSNSGHPAIEWLGPTTLSADDLTDQGPRLTKVNLAASFIEGLLAHGEMSSQRFDEIAESQRLRS